MAKLIGSTALESGNLTIYTSPHTDGRHKWCECWTQAGCEAWTDQRYGTFDTALAALSHAAYVHNIHGAPVPVWDPTRELVFN